MKEHLKNIFIAVLFLFSLSTHAQNKYALLIGVSDYPINQSKHQLWQELNADNDLTLLKKTLPKQGFQSDHIYTLENEKVTPEGVAKAVDDLCEKLAIGDIVVFHFSGHGQQITDLDNVEFDGFDEAFVCFSAPTIYYPGYKGEDHLTDDQINVLISKFRKKLGPTGHLLVLFDSCHSGNMSRGSEALNRRGSTTRIEIPKDEMEKIEIENTTKGNSDWIDNELQDSELSSFCAISGCLSGEVNYEVKVKSNTQYGSLTYAFCEMLRQPGIEKMNYQDVSLKIKQIIQNKGNSQHPSVEGELKTLFLSGQAIGIKPYFEVNSIENDTILIDAGLLSNLNLGDSLVFKNSSNSIVTKGAISWINATQCKIRSSKVKSKMKLPLSNYTAEVLTRNLSAEFITLYIKGSKKLTSSLRDSLSNLYGYTLVSDSLEARLILEIKKDRSLSCFVKNQPDLFIRNIIDQPISSLATIRQEMEAYFLMKRFTAMEIHEDLPVSFAVKRFSKPVSKQDENNTYKLETREGVLYTHELDWDEGIIGKMKKDDLIQIELKSTKPIYFVLLNLNNGELITKEDNLNSKIIAKGKSETKWIQVEKGDVFKILISEKPFNLANAPAVLQGKSNLTRGSGDVTEFLFSKSNITRGSEQNFSISNLFVEID